MGHLCSEGVAVPVDRRVEIADRYGDMVDLGEHHRSLRHRSSHGVRAGSGSVERPAAL